MTKGWFVQPAPLEPWRRWWLRAGSFTAWRPFRMTPGITEWARWACWASHHQSYPWIQHPAGPRCGSWYTEFASNTTVVVRLLWVEPEFPPNFPPFVFGVNNWQC